MNKVNIIISGDKHLDLKSEGLDRTDDIIDSMYQIIDYMSDILENNYNEKIIHLDLGDIFHGTRPRAEVIARAIRTYGMINSLEIPTYMIAGNHDVIDQQGKTSALAPLDAVGFEYLKIYHDIKLVNIFKGSSKDINIITLPHISKARAVEQGYKNVQDYIDTISTEIEAELDENDINIVIGHMNIEGAKTGTETYMIKGSHEEFPKVLKSSDKVTYIFNGHIHRPQNIANPDGAPIVITGDVQTNDFGERLDTKIFLHLEIEV